MTQADRRWKGSSRSRLCHSDEPLPLLMPAAEPRQRRNQERRANIARRSSRLLAQSLRSEDFTRMISEKQKTLTAAKPQGSQPITPEPAPSPRLWASAWARPLADAITLTRTRKYPRLKGDILTLLEKGTFSFCLDMFLILSCPHLPARRSHQQGSPPMDR